MQDRVRHHEKTLVEKDVIALQVAMQISTSVLETDAQLKTSFQVGTTRGTLQQLAPRVALRFVLI
eukprot:3913616-Amphidinium_carterae.1